MSKLAMASRSIFLSGLATLAYLGLAILGWGGFAAFFAHPALTAVTELFGSGAGLGI